MRQLLMESKLVFIINLLSEVYMTSCSQYGARNIRLLFDNIGFFTITEISLTELTYTIDKITVQTAAEPVSKR